jgi:hypothetical protein
MTTSFANENGPVAVMEEPHNANHNVQDEDEDHSQQEPQQRHILDGVEYDSYQEMVDAKRKRNQQVLQGLGLQKASSSTTKSQASQRGTKRQKVVETEPAFKRTSSRLSGVKTGHVALDDNAVTWSSGKADKMIVQVEGEGGSGDGNVAGGGNDECHLQAPTNEINEEVPIVQVEGEGGSGDGNMAGGGNDECHLQAPTNEINEKVPYQRRLVRLEKPRPKWTQPRWKKQKRMAPSDIKKKEKEVERIIAEECATLLGGFSYIEPPPTLPIPLPTSPCTCKHCFKSDGSRQKNPKKKDYTRHMVSGEYASVTEMYHVWYGLGHYTDLPLPGGINALEKQASKWRDVESRSGRTIEGRKKRANLNALRKIVRAVVNRQNVSDESLAMTLREFDQLFRNTRKKGMLQTRRKGMLQLIQMLKAKKFIEGQQSSLTVDPPVGHQEYCSLLVIP